MYIRLQSRYTIIKKNKICSISTSDQNGSLNRDRTEEIMEMANVAIFRILNDSKKKNLIGRLMTHNEMLFFR